MPVFGRKRKQEEAAAEAAREAERHALFARLATRPDNVCPFLGLAEDRVGYQDGATPEHRCYAFGDPAPLSGDQQTKVCLDRGYGNCPRYLRGVLVIPTDELEALRRPAAATAAPPSSQPAPAGEGRRRRPIAVWLIPVLLLLVVAGAGGVALLGGGLPPIARQSPTPELTPSATLGETATPVPTETPAPTPTLTPEPTPQPGAEFIGYEVAVSPGDYTLFEVDDEGELIESRDATFDALSRGAVDRIEAPNGLLHWRTRGGGYDGLSYVRDRSGDFVIREVHRAADGTLGYVRLDPEET